jgi:hypothetical protein
MKNIICPIFILILSSYEYSYANDDYRKLPDNFTYINDDNVNVRELPSIKSKVITKLLKGAKLIVSGISEKSDNIDGEICYWLRIAKQEDPKIKPLGWVFGKYVFNGTSITPSKLKINSFGYGKNFNGEPLSITYFSGTKKIEDTVRAHYDVKNSYYTFSYTSTNTYYDWHCVPGSYILYPETGELKHISYIGSSEEATWVLFSSDLKYLIQVTGSLGFSGWMNRIDVWNISNNTKVFSGNHYGYNGDTKLRDSKNDHIIQVAYPVSWYSWSHGGIDDELLAFTKNYLSENKISSEAEANKIIIIGTIDLDTMERKILNAQI